MALIMTAFEPGTLVGAVYRPVESIVPFVVFPPATPFTNQLTVVFDEPVTVAVNCFGGSPARTFAEPGETPTVMFGGGGGFEPDPDDVPPQ
jgi:hypothetical protein